MTRQELGKALKEKREQKGIIKNQLIKSGVRFNEIQTIESGRKGYTIDKLLIYLDAIGESINI